jgi:dTDP-4-amino-4,6-dideoxygalactose transaminase
MSLKSIKHNPFQVVRMFEEELCEYTGAKYAVAVDSCTNALLLCLLYHQVKGQEVIVPKRTYLSVPQSVILAGGTPVFEDVEWSGRYQLKPYPIYDSAKLLTSDMYIPGTFMCLSFHIKKQLPIGKGGAILCDNLKAVEWFKQMRYEGRSEKNYMEDNITLSGYNFYMQPEEAARGLWLMMNYPASMPALQENDGAGYRDLTEFDVFKKYKVLKNHEKTSYELNTILEKAWKGTSNQLEREYLLRNGYITMDGERIRFTDRTVEFIMNRHK